MTLIVSYQKILLSCLLVLFGFTVFAADPAMKVKETGISVFDWVVSNWAFILFLISEALSIFSKKYPGILKLLWPLIRRTAQPLENRLR